MLIAELRIDELDDVEGPSDEELNQIEEEEFAEEEMPDFMAMGLPMNFGSKKKWIKKYVNFMLVHLYFYI